MLVKLNAKSAGAARREIKNRWPNQDVNYTGYNKDNEPVLMSLVRGQTKGNVATLKRNCGTKPIRFEAKLSDR